MDLSEAVVQIATIRQQLARSERFHGFRAMPVACTGLLAFAGGALQAHWVAQPTEHWVAFLALWIALATVSFTICLAGVWLRYRRNPRSILFQESAHMALGQLFPSLAAGALLTLVIARYASHLVWMLPGLWAVLFSLGIFASARLLPKPIVAVAAYYLAAGLYTLTIVDEAHQLSPWMMPAVFGVGQCFTACVLLLSQRSSTQ